MLCLPIFCSNMLARRSLKSSLTAPSPVVLSTHDGTPCINRFFIRIAPTQPPLLSNDCICRAPRRSFATRAAAAAGNGSSGKRITQQEFTEKAWQAVVAAPEIATEYQQQVGCHELLLQVVTVQYVVAHCDLSAAACAACAASAVRIVDTT
jgi:hypothetical protein